MSVKHGCDKADYWLFGEKGRDVCYTTTLSGVTDFAGCTFLTTAERYGKVKERETVNSNDVVLLEG